MCVFNVITFEKAGRTRGQFTKWPLVWHCARPFMKYGICLILKELKCFYEQYITQPLADLHAVFKGLSSLIINKNSGHHIN